MAHMAAGDMEVVAMPARVTRSCPYGGADCFACPLPDCALTNKYNATTINRLAADGIQPVTRAEVLTLKRLAYAAASQRGRRRQA